MEENQPKPVEVSPALGRPQIQEPKPKNAAKLIAIFCGVLAIAGVGFGIYEMLELNKAKNQVSTLRSEIQNLTNKSPASTSPDTTDDVPQDGFVLQGMGIKINNLAMPRFYLYSTEPHGPADPTSSITLGYESSIPKLADGTTFGTDSLPVYNIATIYQYNEQYLFNHEEECSVELGKIGELNYCVAKLDCSEICESQSYSEEVKQSWRNAFNEISDSIFEILSNPSNYSAI